MTLLVILTIIFAIIEEMSVRKKARNWRTHYKYNQTQAKCKDLQNELKKRHGM